MVDAVKIYQRLTEEQIDGLEQFIRDHTPLVGGMRDCISSTELKYGKQIYEDLLTTEGPKYAIFGLCGYTSFSLYKSRDQTIYMFRVYMQDLDAYSQVNNDARFTL